MTEFRLFDAPGTEVAQITTDGETFKPFVNALTRVDDEARIHINEDGLSVAVVDPANVFMADAHLNAEAFDTYNVSEETTIGANTEALKSLIRRARKGSDDELTLSIQERELTATVSRGYDNHNVVSQGTMGLLNPDSIRSEPDIPSLDWNVNLEVDVSPFTDALSYAVGVADHVEVSVKGVNQHANALYLGGETDTRDEMVAIDNISVDETASSLYSADYVVDMLDGIGDVDVDTVELRLDEEYPMAMGLENAELSVEYLLSPRIQS